MSAQERRNLGDCRGRLERRRPGIDRWLSASETLECGFGGGFIRISECRDQQRECLGEGRKKPGRVAPGDSSRITGNDRGNDQGHRSTDQSIDAADEWATGRGGGEHDEH